MLTTALGKDSDSPNSTPTEHGPCFAPGKRGVPDTSAPAHLEHPNQLRTALLTCLGAEA